MVGTTSVLRGFNIRLDPSIRTSMRYDPLNQCSSKCFEHNRRFFGIDVLQIAWIHAGKKFLTFGNAESNFWIVLFTLGLEVALKGDTVRHLLLFYRYSTSRATKLRHKLHCSARPFKMADSGRFELATKAYSRPREKKYLVV